MPDLRRLYRRFTDSHLPTRLIAHLSVVSLVGLASFTGLTQEPGDVSSVHFAGTQPGFEFVATARGAAPEQGDPASVSVFSLSALPADDLAQLDRGARAHAPIAAAPLPTPMPLDPNATPLAAPVSVGETTSASGPSSRGAAPVPFSGGLVWPIPEGSISQYFHAGHLALDIAAPYGSQIVAAQSGVVTWAGWRNNGGGNVIAIDHGNGMQTVYNHLGSLWVGAGQWVAAGQGIGGVGCTGICTGPHVHFEVIVNGIIDNPQRYF